MGLRYVPAVLAMLALILAPSSAQSQPLLNNLNHRLAQDPPQIDAELLTEEFAQLCDDDLAQGLPLSAIQGERCRILRLLRYVANHANEPSDSGFSLAQDAPQGRTVFGAVGRVVIEFGDHSTLVPCTGSLLLSTAIPLSRLLFSTAEDMLGGLEAFILTNRHCFEHGTPTAAVVRMGFFNYQPENVGSVYSLDLPRLELGTSDFALIPFSSRQDGLHAAARFGAQALRFRQAHDGPLLQSTPTAITVRLAGHPSGLPLLISNQPCQASNYNFQPFESFPTSADRRTPSHIVTLWQAQIFEVSSDDAGTARVSSNLDTQLASPSGMSISHNCVTRGGNSGSPLLYSPLTAGTNMLIALHSGDDQSEGADNRAFSLGGLARESLTLRNAIAVQNYGCISFPHADNWQRFYFQETDLPTLLRETFKFEASEIFSGAWPRSTLTGGTQLELRYSDLMDLEPSEADIDRAVAAIVAEASAGDHFWVGVTSSIPQCLGSLTGRLEIAWKRSTSTGRRLADLVAPRLPPNTSVTIQAEVEGRHPVQYPRPSDIVGTHIEIGSTRIAIGATTTQPRQ